MTATDRGKDFVKKKPKTDTLDVLDTAITHSELTLTYSEHTLNTL